MSEPAWTGDRPEASGARPARLDGPDGLDAQHLTPDPVSTEDKGVAQLLRDLASETNVLVRQEIRLAQAEMTAKAKALGAGAGLLAAAALLGLALLGAFTALLILLFHLALAAWAAALVVTVILAAVVAGLALAGRNKLRRGAPPAPTQTIQEAKEDAQWARTLPQKARK